VRVRDRVHKSCVNTCVRGCKCICIHVRWHAYTCACAHTRVCTHTFATNTYTYLYTYTPISFTFKNIGWFNGKRIKCENGFFSRKRCVTAKMKQYCEKSCIVVKVMRYCENDSLEFRANLRHMNNAAHGYSMEMLQIIGRFVADAQCCKGIKSIHNASQTN